MNNLQEIVDSRSWTAIHNARLVDVSADDEGLEVLTVEASGETVRIKTGSKFSSESWRLRSIGRVGVLLADAGPTFIEYTDQTLRRAPELDAMRKRERVIGWRCEAQPRGFLAPPGLIPGECGGFIENRTTPITIDVPEEMVRVAREHQLSVEELLRGFIADLCGLQSYVVRPRADGYSSNGSDERMLAGDWLDRAYGMNRIDLGPVEEKEQVRDQAQEELGSALDDYIDAGGMPDELIAAVDAFVAAKQAEAGEGDQP